MGSVALLLTIISGLKVITGKIAFSSGVDSTHGADTVLRLLDMRIRTVIGASRDMRFQVPRARPGRL